MKADDGSRLGLEEYVDHILHKPHLGVLELILFTQVMARMGGEASQMYHQVWQGDDTQPMVLWYAPETSGATADSSLLPVTNMKLVVLPQSKKLVWVPLAAVDSNSADGADACKQQMQDLDAQLVAKAQADAKEVPVEPPQQPAAAPRSAFRRRLRSHKPQAKQPAQPAESSGSVLLRRKRGPSPDNDSAAGKAHRM